MKLAKNEHKKLGIANSSIAGWGLFANEDIKKEDLIGEYIGEMVGIEDLNERSEYIDLEKTTYMFTLNDEYTVDSRTMGNILRFANHSKSKANAYAKIVFSKGNHKICLYASDDIKKGQEIFFDYDGQNILCEKYDWINDEKKHLHVEYKERNVKANKNVGTGNEENNSTTSVTDINTPIINSINNNTNNTTTNNSKVSKKESKDIKKSIPTSTSVSTSITTDKEDVTLLNNKRKRKFFPKPFVSITLDKYFNKN